MAQRTTEKQLKSMVAIINDYYRVTMHGKSHRLYLNHGINGYEVAWMDTEKHTISANLVPWTAMPQFILKIRLGNDAMSTDDDIVKALRDVAKTIYYDGTYYKPRKYIRDINGNVVGHYEVRDS